MNMRNNEIAAYFLIVDSENEIESEDMQYYRDRAERFTPAIEELYAILSCLEDDASEEDIQYQFYEVGKKHYGTDKNVLRLWFKDLYCFLWRKESGVRMGTFVKLFGLTEFLNQVFSKMNDPLGLH